MGRDAKRVRSCTENASAERSRAGSCHFQHSDLLDFPTQEPTRQKPYPHTQEGALIWIKFYPNWFIRRSFSLPDRMRSLALESGFDLPLATMRAINFIGDDFMRPVIR